MKGREMETMPFDHGRLDDYMGRHGIDVILATSKHNIQYLTGGHRFFWFDYMDAVGVSRYLPIVGYFRGRPEATFYVGNALEGNQLDNDPVWVPHIETSSWGVEDAIRTAVNLVAPTSGDGLSVGVEPNFLPASAWNQLQKVDGLKLVSAELVLERLRMTKSPEERVIVEEASKRTVDAILATFSQIRPGMTKREVIDILRVEEVKRELVFEYCLATVGSSLNRGPSDQVVREGDIVCLDSGGNYKGYIGDLARMAVVGTPCQAQVHALSEVRAIQDAARAVVAPGVIGSRLFDEAEKRIRSSQFADDITFVAHGMGLVSHEAPRLTSSGPVPYPNEDGNAPLESGMVLSIETTLLHKQLGFIKLEDTAIVTEDGYMAVGDQGRDWNVCDTNSEAYVS